LEVLSQRASRMHAGPAATSPPTNHIHRPVELSALEPSGRKDGPRFDPPAGRAASSTARQQAEIYTLADAGLTSADIAGRIGSPVGEVELILGLRQTRESGEG